MDVLLWVSDPCVVIGRHQNPWLEANMRELRARGWALARRQSGGGAVFHDHGNINVSFITSTASMNRRRFMGLLCDQVTRLSPRLNISVGERFDLWSKDHGTQELLKISGAASRFGSHVSYHHCTLLVQSKLAQLSSTLRPSFEQITSTASKSVRSKVTNLNLPVEDVLSSVAKALAERSTCSRGVLEFREQDMYRSVDHDWFETEMNRLRSWEWIYGNSPRAEIRAGFFRLVCEKGRITNLTCDQDAPQMPEIAEKLRGLPCVKHILQQALLQLHIPPDLSQLIDNF